MKRNLNKNSTYLKEALKESRKAAKRGAKLADKKLDKLSNEIDDITDPINQLIEKSKKSNVANDTAVKDLNSQLKSIIKGIYSVRNEVEQKVHKKRELLNDFKVTLFGRTKAGKSTLMEILTKGDGKSIGKGKQRTTKDIRPYTWEGLKITDVPGIAAFGGEDDEQVAYKEAEMSDLIVFLITDDAPQPSEAACFSDVRSLGKPLIGVCNVKIGIPDEVSKVELKLFFRDSKNLYTPKIKTLIEQFYDFVREYSATAFTPFTVTHLHSRFLANQKEFKKYSKDLIQASQFNRFENRLIGEVKTNGTFYRNKVFIDLVTQPYHEFQKLLLNYSSVNSKNARVVIDKQRKFWSWKSEFCEMSHGRIDAFLDREFGKLRIHVPEFAEDHYDDRNAGIRWNDYVESLGLQEKVESLQKTLYDECKNKLNEIAKDLEKETNYVSAEYEYKSISGESVTDTRRRTRWVSTGLGIIGGIVLLSNPAGWVLAAGWGLVAVGGVLGVGTFFQKSREEKKRKARNTLSKKINKSIDSLERDVSKKLKKWLKRTLLEGLIDDLNNGLMYNINGLIQLADAQRDLAWSLNKEVLSLNRRLLKKALNTVGGDTEFKKINKISRVPGNAWLLMLDTGIQFSPKIKDRLQVLLGETVWFVIDNHNIRSIISQAIGYKIDSDDISIEKKLKAVHIKINGIDQATQTRINLAQQLTEYHIMKS